MGWIGPAISIGTGALGGALGGPKEPKENRAARRYWLKRIQDQEEQARRAYEGYYDETGAWQPGSRLRAESGYEDIYNAPGFTEEERAGLYLTPEEEESIRLSPQYRESIRTLAVAPIEGAARRATDALTRASAARGNYGGGYGANIEEVQREQGRQGAEALLRANLGLAEQDREAARWLASQRTRTQERIGEARMGQQEFGAGGRFNVSQQDVGRMRGYGEAGQYGSQNYPPTTSTWGRALEGGFTAASPWLSQWGAKRTQPSAMQKIGIPGPGYTLGAGRSRYGYSRRRPMMIQ